MARGIPNQRPDGTTGPDETTDGGTTPAVPESAVDGTAAKPLTHAQKARQDAAEAQAEADRVTLSQAESFSVLFPTGISLHVGDGAQERKVTVGGKDVWIDAENGHLHLPKGALVRAESLEDLEALRRLASMRFLESIAAEAP